MPWIFAGPQKLIPSLVPDQRHSKSKLVNYLQSTENKIDGKQQNPTCEVSHHCFKIYFTTRHCFCDGLSSEVFYYSILYEDNPINHWEIIYFKNGHQNVPLQSFASFSQLDCIISNMSKRKMTENLWPAKSQSNNDSPEWFWIQLSAGQHLNWINVPCELARHVVETIQITKITNSKVINPRFCLVFVIFDLQW